MSERTIRAAAAQMCAGGDLTANLATCRRLVAEAAGRGASLVVLPENFAFLGRTETDRLAVAEALAPEAPGPILAALTDMATRHRVWLVGGGMPEAIPPGELAGQDHAPGASAARTYNTCVVLAPNGRLVASYRKIHLFDVDIPGRAVLRESRGTAPGRVPMLFDMPAARVGLSVCYDLRFPELYRELVVGRGAHVVLVPAAFTAHTGAAHWHVLLRARAIENQCYVVAAAQTGQHNDRRASYGHSMVVDPWGTILDELADGEGVVVADVDLDLLDETRQRMPCLDHQVLLGTAGKIRDAGAEPGIEPGTDPRTEPR